MIWSAAVGRRFLSFFLGPTKKKKKKAASKRRTPKNGWSRLLLDGFRLPIFDQVADVAIVVIEIGQLAAEIDGAVHFTAVGVTCGEIEHRLFAEHTVGGVEMLQGFFEIALCKPPVVARLEAHAEVE